MVVPKANPKANKVAANAANPKGTIGGGSPGCTHVNLDCVPPKGEPIIKLCVHCHHEDESSMSAAQRGQQEEERERGVVLVTTAVVDPGAVVVHLHYTSVTLSAMV